MSPTCGPYQFMNEKGKCIDCADECFRCINDSIECEKCSRHCPGFLDHPDKGSTLQFTTTQTQDNFPSTFSNIEDSIQTTPEGRDGFPSYAIVLVVFFISVVAIIVAFICCRWYRTREQRTRNIHTRNTKRLNDIINGMKNYFLQRVDCFHKQHESEMENVEMLNLQNENASEEAQCLEQMLNDERKEVEHEKCVIKIENLEKKLVDSGNTNVYLHDKYKFAANKVEELEHEIETERDKINNLTEAKAIYADKVKDLERKLDSTRNEVNTLKEEKSVLIKYQEELLKSERDKSEILLKARAEDANKIKDLEQKLDMKRNKINKLKIENEKATLKVGALKRQQKNENNLKALKEMLETNAKATRDANEKLQKKLDSKLPYEPELKDTSRSMSQMLDTCIEFRKSHLEATNLSDPKGFKEISQHLETMERLISNRMSDDRNVANILECSGFVQLKKKAKEKNANVPMKRDRINSSIQPTNEELEGAVGGVQSLPLLEIHDSRNERPERHAKIKREKGEKDVEKGVEEAKQNTTFRLEGAVGGAQSLPLSEIQDSRNESPELHAKFKRENGEKDVKGVEEAKQNTTLRSVKGLQINSTTEPTDEVHKGAVGGAQPESQPLLANKESRNERPALYVKINDDKRSELVVWNRINRV